MKTKVTLFTAIIIVLFILSTVNAQRQTSSSKSAWAARVIKASSPSKVATYGGGGSRETPSKGQQWVSLTVEVIPPEGKDHVIKDQTFDITIKPGDIVFRGVRLVDGAKNVYQALAIDCLKKASASPDPRFIFFESTKDPKPVYLPLMIPKDSWTTFEDRPRTAFAGYIFVDYAGKPVVRVWDKEILRFEPGKATIFLLFETPITSKQLFFQIGGGKLIPIQLTKQ